MSDQITLLDVCKLPDVQIHSKTALFKYLVGRETTEMLKLRENIVKLSYTNKIIGVKGDQVGIISKRLPLKFKQAKLEQNKKQTNEQFMQDTGYISHRNFYVHPLPTVRKSQSESNLKVKRMEPISINVKIETNQNQNYHILNIETTKNDGDQRVERFNSTKSFRSRTQSKARLKGFSKKQIQQDFQIKRKYESKNRNLEGNVKSFSNLLKEIKVNTENKNLLISPIMHEENTLFKRYQRLSEKQINRRASDESEVQNLMQIVDDS